jgi:outer membrane protein assembly factor BamD (BamD/ComL family)
MGLLHRIRARWNRDAVERAELEAEMTQTEREIAEDYADRKEDLAAQRFLQGGAADYERDSEPPQP